MTRADFFEKHGEFSTSEMVRELFLYGCSTPDRPEDMAFLTMHATGNIYNRVWLGEGTMKELETDWAALSADLATAEELETILKGVDCRSEGTFPYLGFVVPNFNFNQETFTQDFFKKIGIFAHTTEYGTPPTDISHCTPIRFVAPGELLLRDQSVIEEGERATQEFDYPTLAIAEEFMYKKLKNLCRIDFNDETDFLDRSFSVSASLLVFYMGQSQQSSNLIGLVSYTIYT